MRRSFSTLLVCTWRDATTWTKLKPLTAAANVRKSRTEEGEGGAKGRSVAAPFPRFPFVQLFFVFYAIETPISFLRYFFSFDAAFRLLIVLYVSCASHFSSRLLLSRVALSAVGKGVCRAGAGYPIAVKLPAHRLFISGRQKAH